MLNIAATDKPHIPMTDVVLVFALQARLTESKALPGPPFYKTYNPHAMALRSHAEVTDAGRP
jgi:hypothetical protein